MEDAPENRAETKIPPRYWWLKRILIASALFLAALAILRWQAGIRAQRRLDQAIARMRARHERVLPSDFVEPPVSDDENAAFFIRNAIAGLDLSPKEDSLLRFIVQSATTTPVAADASAADALLARKTEVLRQVRLARARSRVNWNDQFARPVMQTVLPSWGAQSNLCRLVVAAALQAHRRGDDAAALEYLRDAVALSDAYAHRPFLVSHLTAIAVNGVTCSTIGTIAPALQIQNDDPSSRAATTAHVDALIRELLDETALRDGFILGMECERMSQLDTVQWLAAGKVDALSGTALEGRWLLAPMFLNDGRDLLLHSGNFREALRQPNLSTTAPNLPSAPLSSPMLRVISIAWSPLFSRHFQSLSDRRSAAFVLAARQYQLKHGRPPQRVEDLVPEFLPTILEDPINGGPLPVPVYASPSTQPAPP